MATFDEKVPVTLEMIKRDIEANAGKGAMGWDISFICNCPAYMRYLIDRLEQAERPCWKKALDFVAPPAKAPEQLAFLPTE